MLNIRELFIKLSINVDDSAVAKADRALENFKKQATGAGNTAARSFGGFLGSTGNSLDLINEAASNTAGMVLSLAKAFTVGGLSLGGFFKVVGDFEQTEVAFETMLGSAEQAKKTLGELQRFAKTTPFQFSDVAEFSKRLLAMSFTADDLIPTMTALGNIAAGVGKEKLPQLVLALGQVKAAGKLRGSELRQFTEAGVPLTAELAKTLGVTEAQVTKLVESGKVGFKDVFKALQAVTGEGGRFNNLMQKQSGTLLGMVSNITDTLQMIMIDLGKRGMLKRAKDFTNGVLRILETHREQILVGLQTGIEVLIDALDRVIDIARGAWQVFSGLAQTVGGSRKAIELLIRGLLLLVSMRMVTNLGKFAQGVGGIAKAFVGLGDAALVSQMKISAMALAVGAAIAGIALIIEDVVAYFQGRKSVTGYILKDLGNISGAFDKMLDPLLEKLKNFGISVGKSVVEGMKALTDADWKNVGNGLITALEVILNVSSIPLRLGIAIAEGIVDGMIAGIQKNFPKLAAFLGIDKIVTKSAGMQNVPADAQTQAMRDLDWKTMLKTMFGFGTADERGLRDKAFGLERKPQGLLTDNEKAAYADLVNFVKGITSPSSPVTQLGATPPPLPDAVRKTFEINANTTVNVPPGTPPEQMQAIIESRDQNLIDKIIRETSRLTAPKVH